MGPLTNYLQNYGIIVQYIMLGTSEQYSVTEVDIQLLLIWLEV